MELRVNSNISSINAQRNLVNTTDRLGKSLQRLSSGLRISRAAGDAAGLGISDQFRAEIRILQSGAPITFQIGTGAGADDRFTVSAVNATASAIGINGLAVSSASGALSALALLDSAVGLVASLRASFGTAQNRLESAIRSIAIAVENTAAADSRLRDVDFASETAELTRNQVLQQAGISVLAQANVSTQAALSLLRG